MTIEPRKEITKLLTESGKVLESRGLIGSTQIHQTHDIHAYCDLKLDDQVLHVQGYPGMSNEHEMMIVARVMDGKLLDEIRRDKKFSIGNEHEAIIRGFRHTQGGIYVPYSQVALTGILSSCIYETYFRNVIDKVKELIPHVDEIEKIMREEVR
jgi:hypothetical protein